MIEPSMLDPPLALPQAAWLCLQCGADFRNWVELPHEVRMAFLMEHRAFLIARLLADRCPRCDAPLTVAGARDAGSGGPWGTVQ